MGKLLQERETNEMPGQSWLSSWEAQLSTAQICVQTGEEEREGKTETRRDFKLGKPFPFLVEKKHILNLSSICAAENYDNKYLPITT